MIVRQSLAFALCFVAAAGVRAQTAVNLKGRVLERANMDAVPNALVAIAGTQLSAHTDAAGRFSLTGSSALRLPPGPDFTASEAADAPLLAGRYLRLPSRWNGRAVRLDVFDFRGARLASRSVPPNADARLDVLPEIGLSALTGRILQVTSRGESFRFRLPPAGAPAGEAAVVDLESPSLGKAAAISANTVQLDVGADLLVKRTLAVRPDSGDLGDIVLEYPPRRVDTGAPPIYGALRLFDGKGDSASVHAQMDSNWIMWVGPYRKSHNIGATPVVWKILRDPQVGGDHQHWTFSECCGVPAGGPDWGYDDIVTKRTFNDYQLHVEFNLMGTPGDEDPSGYCNSGVYQENRYELQIETIPTPWDPNNTHGMASIINEYAPPSNLSRPQGIWQAYDITFRNDRYVAGKRAEFARTTIWWNGRLIHDNRKIAGAIACCDAGNVPMDSTLQGLKLQNEKGADVRFRNIWIKPLTIKDTLTNIGY